MNSDYLNRVQNPFRMVDKPEEVGKESNPSLANILDFNQKNGIVRTHLKQTPTRKRLYNSDIDNMLKD